jgi:hypothetical protein
MTYRGHLIRNAAINVVCNHVDALVARAAKFGLVDEHDGKQPERKLQLLRPTAAEGLLVQEDGCDLGRKI